ncbi:hypothetical protein KI387_023774, partial [Taxus chinensis]
MQEGIFELPEDACHEEEEMDLGEFQRETSTYVLTHVEDIFSFSFGDEDTLDHVIREEKRPTCDEPSK